MGGSERTWHETVDLVEPFVFRIATPRGSGTGFLVANPANRAVCVVATAAHVVDDAHYWEQPIRLTHEKSGVSVLARHQDRAVFLDAEHDTAAVLLNIGDLQLPTTMLPFAPKGQYFKVGNDIGWLGFPAIPGADMCFFGGKVSAILPKQDAYLVDGVAINGVSGGPVFHPTSDQPMIMGVVSAYMPNRATGATLPGLAVVRSVRTFHDLAPTFASLEEAKSQETPPGTALPSQQLESGDDVSINRRK